MDPFFVARLLSSPSVSGLESEEALTHNTMMTAFNRILDDLLAKAKEGLRPGEKLSDDCLNQFSEFLAAKKTDTVRTGVDRGLAGLAKGLQNIGDVRIKSGATAAFWIYARAGQALGMYENLFGLFPTIWIDESNVQREADTLGVSFDLQDAATVLHELAHYGGASESDALALEDVYRDYMKGSDEKPCKK